MFLVPVAFTLVLAVSDPSPSEGGVIRGRVVNGSRNDTPCGQTEVILRAQVEGEFAPVAQTVTDLEGNYQFAGLPVGAEYLYLPGANRDEIHYPGRRVGLTSSHPTAYVTLEVRDALAEPCPLVIRRHEVVLGTEPDAVHVAESLLVHNPTAATYVGRAATADGVPVTLRLNIPSDFERVTFEKERFGREFQVVHGQLVTGMPWLPGQQWLKFTYTLRSRSGTRAWQRTLDAPCEAIRVRVEHEPAGEVACNLPPVAGGPPEELVYQSVGAPLAAGHEIRVQLGRTPVSWPVRLRWAAAIVLFGLVAAAAFAVRRDRRSPAAGKGPWSSARRGRPRPAVSLD